LPSIYHISYFPSLFYPQSSDSNPPAVDGGGSTFLRMLGYDAFDIVLTLISERLPKTLSPFFTLG
jgi:hypothetical protein